MPDGRASPIPAEVNLDAVIPSFVRDSRLHSRRGAILVPFDWAHRRVSVLLCMTDLAHASKLKEHDDNDDFQGTTGRAA